MMPPEVRKAWGPLFQPAFQMWHGAGEERHVVLILEGSEGVHMYCLSPVDAQVALAEADLTQDDTIAKLALNLAEPPGDGKFWILYMMSTCLGLLSFRWRDYSRKVMD